MKNKTIAIIVKYFFPVTAGIETNIAQTYSVLAKKGWGIAIHTSTDTLTEKNTLKKRDTILGLSVNRYVFGKFGYFPLIDWTHTDIIALHNFDIFPHLHIMAYLFFSKLLSKKTGRVILTPHGGFNPEWSTFPFIQRIVKRFYHYTVGVWLINQTVDVVRAVSEWEKQEMISRGIKKQKIVLIPNGVEDEAYMDVDKKASPSIKKSVASFGRYMIQIGRIYSIKNYETTIRAMTQIPKDVKFVIAGPLQKDRRYQQYLEKLIKGYNLLGRVIFVGVIKGVDKYYLIKHAQLMVHMAIWESFCNVVHEGLSQGLVCIVANNTALPYLIKDGLNGYCVETKNSKKVAEKINFVLKNKKAKQIIQMEKRNKEYGLAYSWTKVAEEVDTVYTKILT